ncbi:MAG: hypothetical protein MMC23_000306 [Stictis urceolatum]|nr:hypothetical protein [Stictis urceolata]
MEVAYPMQAKKFHLSDDNGNTNGTLPADIRKLVNKLLVKDSQQHRTAIIITTVFSVVASLLVIYSILRDAYRVKEGEAYSPAQKRLGFLKVLHPAEFFPFVTAVAVVAQGFIFIGIQAGGLKKFWAQGCRLTAELVWPAVWLVPIVILVFSLEVTWRSIQRTRFKPRGKWTTPICLATAALLLLALWLIAFFWPALDMCPASLIWWTVHYSKLGVVFGPGIILTHFISAAILTRQLWRTVKMDRDERIAASRVVYSLGVNVLIIVFLLPFWIERLIGEFPKETSKLADIAVTLSGLAHSTLYVILRANAERLAIRPRETPWSVKRKMRLFGPNDLSVGMFISTPLLANPQQTKDWQEWQNTKERSLPLSLHNSTNPRPAPSPRPVPLSAGSTIPPSYPTTAMIMQPKKVVSPQHQRKRTKSSYSIFPTAASAKPTAITSWLSSRSTSDDEPLPLPPPLFGRKHARNDSTITSATVEIGMRLSSMQDVQMGPRPSESIELPRISSDILEEERRMSRAPQVQQRESVQRPPRSSSRTKWLGRDSFAFDQQRKRQMMKSLPPTPATNSTRISRVPPPPLALSSNPPIIRTVTSPSQRSSASTQFSPGFRSPGYSPPPDLSPQASPWPLPMQPVRPAENWI